MAVDTQIFPLSFAQQRLWFLDQLQPGNPAYNIPVAVGLAGPLDIAALKQCFEAIVQRHQALRTTFTMSGGRPRQVVAAAGRAALPMADLRACPAAERKAAAMRLTIKEARRSFDLARDSPLRATLLRLGEDEHMLLLTMHHIVSDGWSMSVFIRELGAFYEAFVTGRPASLPELPIQYVDFVEWQRASLQGAELEAQMVYWKRHLRDLAVLELPTDRPRPPNQTFDGARRYLMIPRSSTDALKRLSQRNGATLYMTLLAAFQTLLARYSGQDDITVGSAFANRMRPETRLLIGFLLNTLVLRTDLSGDPSFLEALRRARGVALDAFTYLDLPFERLVEELQQERDPSRNPLFQVMFAFQNVQLPPLNLPGLTLELLEIDSGRARFDLTLELMERAEGVFGWFEYNTDLFDAATIMRMAWHFQTLLESIVADPDRRLSQLPLLYAAERQQLLLEWNDASCRYAHDSCVHRLVETQVRRTPDAVALVFEDELLTYGELNRRANQLAAHLRALGAGAETLIGICVERSPALLVGLLGILKTGAAYVPLDPAFPTKRLNLILEDAQVWALLTRRPLADRLPRQQARMVLLDEDWRAIARQGARNPPDETLPDQTAYVIYTSGSTGRPKGVAVSHRNVVNFFSGMDRRIGCDDTDTVLAVTSISFDIAVLELFWTLTRGARVAIVAEQTARWSADAADAPQIGMQFSLFYFASADDVEVEDKYRLLIEGAKFADRHGFTAVWTPERHFHPFGGLYPNPAVTSAALATVTERIQLRGGSVVLPLHDPIRIAEEWSVVDNLSKGRVGIAFASGWHADDFALAPDHYANRYEVLDQGIATVQRLWRGESITVRGGAGNEIAVRLFPRPVRPKLPIWITSAGSPETFAKAGALGAHVLTHLLGQTIEELAQKIQVYRDALAQHGYDPNAGHVTLMVHTFIGEDRETVRARVREPFTNYLRSSVGLIANLIKSLDLPLDLGTMSDQDMDDLLAFAFERYFETSALFGTVNTCATIIRRLRAIGVDEIACLIDFGVDADLVLESLRRLDELKTLCNRRREPRDYSLAAQAARYAPSLLQCTPSMMQMLTLQPQTLHALLSLRVLMLGGEALPEALAQQIQSALPCRIVNMYGPTETTVWSSTSAIGKADGAAAIGRPIANTRIYILERSLQPAPIGVIGELYIGGLGVARGYLSRPDLTAERFIPNPFAGVEDGRWKMEDSDADATTALSSIFNPRSSIGARLYKTGDRARFRPDGAIEFLGRLDAQVKIRGYRIEPGEIEAVLGKRPGLREAVVVAREDAPGEVRLVAYVTPSAADQAPADGRQDATSDSSFLARDSALVDALRVFLKERLPEYMLPAAFVVLDALPLTPNGKIDRRALPRPETAPVERILELPRTPIEVRVAEIWGLVLKRDRISIHDNFFEVGGHSLLATLLISHLRDAFDVEIPLRRLLDAPTIAGLAGVIEKELIVQSGVEQAEMAEMLQELEGLSDEEIRALLADETLRS